jgi:hypothetical protein
VNEDPRDDRAARVPLSCGDCSVKAVETPGTDWVMVALLVRSRMTSSTSVASLLEEVPWWARGMELGMELRLELRSLVAVFVDCL